MDQHARRAAAELVEVVAPDGTVERVVTRARMRAEALRHRCTYVAVVDSSDRLVVHQRAPWKDVFPSAWDIAFGGVVGVGESWESAALRELAEEAGVSAPLTELRRMSYDDPPVHVVGVAYLARHDGPFSFPDGEVVAHGRVALPQVRAWAAERFVCPDSFAFLADLLRRGTANRPERPTPSDSHPRCGPPGRHAQP